MADAIPIPTHPEFQDLTGREFGRLKVVAYAGRQGTERVWKCVCSCGGENQVRATHLKNGNIRSCGCLRIEQIAKPRNGIVPGTRFGRWTTRRYAGRSRWECLCDCGTIREVVTSTLSSGESTSCGCWMAETAGSQSRTHGKTGSVEYWLWASMKQRCYDPACQTFKNYGGKGIEVCARWLGRNGFANFLADMGPRPSPRHTLDRFPNNKGDYEPGNCRWATWKQQQRNRTNNRILLYKGEAKPMSEWAEIHGLTTLIVFKRLERKWSVEKALETPRPCARKKN